MGGPIALIVQARGSPQSPWLVSSWTLAQAQTNRLGQRRLAGWQADSRGFCSY